MSFIVVMRLIEQNFIELWFCHLAKIYSLAKILSVFSDWILSDKEYCDTVIIMIVVSPWSCSYFLLFKTIEPLKMNNRAMNYWDLNSFLHSDVDCRNETRIRSENKNTFWLKRFSTFLYCFSILSVTNIKNIKDYLCVSFGRTK